MQTLTQTTTQKPSQTKIQKRQKCEIWTRVMGYHRSVSHFNEGKKSEHCSRQHFEETSSMNSDFCQKF